MGNASEARRSSAAAISNIPDTHETYGFNDTQNNFINTNMLD